MKSSLLVAIASAGGVLGAGIVAYTGIPSSPAPVVWAVDAGTPPQPLEPEKAHPRRAGKAHAEKINGEWVRVEADGGIRRK